MLTNTDPTKSAADFHRARIVALKEQRNAVTDYAITHEHWDIYEALTQRIRENEEIIRALES